MRLLERAAKKAAEKAIKNKQNVPPEQIVGVRRVYELGYIDGAKHGAPYCTKPQIQSARSWLSRLLRPDA